MIKAYVADQFGMGLRVGIVRIDGDSRARYILRLGRDQADRRWEPIPAGIEIEPTFTLDEGEGRALTEALTRHYEYAEDSRHLRQDYDAERARVDRFITSLLSTSEMWVSDATGD